MIFIGLSGGKDSMALFDLLMRNTSTSTVRDRIAAVHVDHNIRSAVTRRRDVNLVQAITKRYDVPPSRNNVTTRLSQRVCAA